MSVDNNFRPEEFAQQVRESGVSEIRVAFLDYNGIARARSILVHGLEAALTRGINFSSPTVDFNSRDLFPPSAAFDLSSPDFWELPDPRSFRPVPGSTGVAQMFANLVTATGSPWEGCPRTALTRMEERAAAGGIVFNVGFEPEAYIFRPNNRDVEFVGRPQFATLQGLGLEAAFMADLIGDLDAAGLIVDQWSEEYGPGQVEVNLRHTRPLAACDGLVTFKDLFRSVADRHGLLATFMPKPFGDQAGSGLHVHLSASPLDDPETNLFDDPADGESGLSALGRHCLAGLLEHGEALTALGATTVNSYKRFLPGSWAPTHIVYSYASRAAFVRVPERETPRRLELRVGDPAGNPYIYLTGILAAMLDGVERKLDPGQQVKGDVGALPPDGAPGIRPVPRTLGSALDHLAQDGVMRDSLGSLICDEFVKIKRSEWDAFCMHVDEWDRSWYLGRY